MLEPALWHPWWPDLASFLTMGRHGAYVWSALALCAVSLLAERWALARRARALKAAQQAALAVNASAMARVEARS